MKCRIVQFSEIAKDPTLRLDAEHYLKDEKPNQVWWKRQGEWKMVFSSDDPVAARDHAYNEISLGPITERIEIRDGGGVLETVYDKNWKT